MVEMVDFIELCRSLIKSFFLRVSPNRLGIGLVGEIHLPSWSITNHGQ